MIRRPPRSTLFPYTTLFRSHAAGGLRPSLFRASCAALGVLLAGLGTLTWMQVQVWRDTESLWTHPTYPTPPRSICHVHYSALLVNRSLIRPPAPTAPIQPFPP